MEFIQYHPTTIETAQKRMLITEGVRGEGGRLYYPQPLIMADLGAATNANKINRSHA